MHNIMHASKHGYSSKEPSTIAVPSSSPESDASVCVNRLCSPKPSVLRQSRNLTTTSHQRGNDKGKERQKK